MEAQIVKIGDKKWGSKVSQKLFVDRAFVVKHIRNKHTHLLDAEREQVRPSARSRMLDTQCYTVGSKHMPLCRPSAASSIHSPMSTCCL